jgi:diguanylate cyclase (GGDEF)-like protein/PAS domain S-box-containing protein
VTGYLPIERKRSFRRSRTFGLLMLVFVLACIAGYFVVRAAVTNTIEHQAVAIADIVASQATTARSVYASQIAEKLRLDGYGPSVDSDKRPGHVPIPAQFLKLVGRASSDNADRLYQYKPVSKWNLEATQGLTDDFLRWAWPQLESQDRDHSDRPIAWVPVYRFEEQNGQRVLRYLAADPASQQSCVQCHNAYEQLPETLARRASDGTEIQKQWGMNQLLGALSITIPLDRAELRAGAQIRQTSVFVFGILISSFLALTWFNWRLSKKEIRLVETQTQLEKSEIEASASRKLLVAKQGVEQALAELSTYLQAIDQHAIVSVSDRAGRIVQVNNKFVDISGYGREELIGKDHRIINSGTHPAAFFADMWATIGAGKIWRGVICNRKKSGDEYWVDAAIVPLLDANGKVERFISIRIDITDRKQAEADILHMATHDSLTGLANRALLLERVKQSVESGRRQQDKAAVLFIDLDQFKGVNDSLGHDTGDLLLVQVAQRLTHNVRTEDTVARQGGDEFIVFLPFVDGVAGVQALAEKLLKALSEPYLIQGKTLYIGSSIGVAMFPQDGLSVADLLKSSDTAMYRVKETGRNNYMFFTSSMSQELSDRFALLEDLRQAIARGELSLVYHPIVDVNKGVMESVEVLLRWNHPVRGPLSPLQFIPLAESSGLIISIGDWVFRTACAQWKIWENAGLDAPRMAINLSAIQFHDKRLADRILKILQDTGVEAHELELEITETSLMKQSDEVVGTLVRLTEMGLRIAIDDFGTGYSSLSYLKRFPIDTLKIDQSFVRDLEFDPDDAAIVNTVIAMAHSLKMRVIAEGVETQGQLDFLRAQGCDQYQGYLLCKPLSAAALESRLLKA